MTVVRPPHADWQLAEVNIARLTAPIGDPRVAPFVAALDRVNAVAERMDGFVWRHVDGSGNAIETAIADDPRVIYNASIWRDAPSLERFVWGTVHARFYARRSEWFDALEGMGMALWWVPPGTRFTPREAMARLDTLASDGPGPHAFGWPEAPAAHLWREARCAPLAEA